MSMQPFGLKRWARPAGGLSGLGQLHGGCAATRAMADVPRQRYQSAPRWAMAQRDNAI
ncbi:MAG: hypothetical protein WBF34_33270 [Streptosporangiaceae bacterium]